MGTQIVERHRELADTVIDGRHLGPVIDGETITTEEGCDTLDPATMSPVTTFDTGGADTVDRAVSAADRASAGRWADVRDSERSRWIHEWVDAIEDHRDELTRLECLDTGKPLEQARGEVDGAIDTLRFYAALAADRRGETIGSDPDLHLYTRREPYGVVGQIIPWNFPIWAAAWKLGPALAAGNAAVLKPSTVAPLTPIRIAQLAAETLPPGVVNVVPGGGKSVGTALTSHEQVQKLSFTGSTEVGKGVMAAASRTVTPVTLELGGKSPLLVFEDADLEIAIEAAATGSSYSSGEICDAFSRVLVHEAVREPFLEGLIERAESHVIGDPLDPSTTLGPLTSAAQAQRVREYIDAGLAEGATLLTGGGTPDHDLPSEWYVEPTVFVDVDSDMRIVREEIFGPVQCVSTFATYREAIDAANDTGFGLAAGIATESTDRVHRAAAELETGIVYVNGYGPIRPAAPYGGYKLSGIGRDLGREALGHYQQTKTVYVNLGAPGSDDEP